MERNQRIHCNRLYYFNSHILYEISFIHFFEIETETEMIYYQYLQFVRCLDFAKRY